MKKLFMFVIVGLFMMSFTMANGGPFDMCPPDPACENYCLTENPGDPFCIDSCPPDPACEEDLCIQGLIPPEICFPECAGGLCPYDMCEPFGPMPSYMCEPPIPLCGDNVLNHPIEECDDGNNLDGDGCSSACQIEVPLVPEFGTIIGMLTILSAVGIFFVVRKE